MVNCRLNNRVASLAFLGRLMESNEHKNYYRTGIYTVVRVCFEKKIQSLEIDFNLVRDIKQPNHEFCFPQFFPLIFLSLIRWKRKQHFHWSKTKKNLFWTSKNFVFIFQLLKLRKFRGKNWEKKICSLVVWCHELDKGIDLITEKFHYF